MMSKSGEPESSDSETEKTTGIIEKDAWSMSIPKFLPEHNKHGMIDESKFATLYPAYREKYLREVWPMVQKKLSEEHNLKVHITGWLCPRVFFIRTIKSYEFL